MDCRQDGGDVGEACVRGEGVEAMAVVNRSHPRRAGWWVYRCDACGEAFGFYATPTPPWSKHYCDDCQHPDTHFVGSPHPASKLSDRQFHGEHYKG